LRVQIVLVAVVLTPVTIRWWGSSLQGPPLFGKLEFQNMSLIHHHSEVDSGLEWWHLTQYQLWIKQSFSSRLNPSVTQANQSQYGELWAGRKYFSTAPFLAVHPGSNIPATSFSATLVNAKYGLLMIRQFWNLCLDLLCDFPWGDHSLI